MAEKVFETYVREAGLDSAVRISSAGIDGWHEGEPADPRTVAELDAHGYRSDHAATQVNEDHLAADLLVALDSSHASQLRRLGAPTDRVVLLRAFDESADSESVADPYYSPDDAFAEVREQIEAAVPGLVGWLEQTLSDEAS